MEPNKFFWRTPRIYKKRRSEEKEKLRKIYERAARRD
jgi:hypothetical protein